MALDMTNWAKQRSPVQGTEEEPVPTSEVSPEEVKANSGSGEKTPDQMENLVDLVRNHIPQIEEEVQKMDPSMLLADDQELPEDASDQILELVDTWKDGLPEMLSGIAPEDAIAISDALEGEIAEVDPILIGAWLWRAGELT